MELKDYQQETLSDLEEFVRILTDNGNIANSYFHYWSVRGVKLSDNRSALRSYQNTIPGVPRVTAKVPTAGGKTFIAVNAISSLFRTLPPRKAKVVAWFVPSDAILEQTLKNLSNPSHPYHQCLNAHFNGRVTIIDKDSALQGIGMHPSEIAEQLTILVLSAASFVEAHRQELPLVFRDNGYLLEYLKLYNSDTHRIETSGETALIQVLAYLNPLVIVDESHNFTADLRVDMLRNINPCFIYELTATPRATSNIITFIGAERLKRENMVKLPVIVHNCQNTNDVISGSIMLRENLERQALECQDSGGKYIRPIVLFQAQPKTSETSETFTKIKKTLIEQYSIPEEEIKIKTANVNELRGVDLMSPTCPVRFIVTVNALKEGWDCPYAYILASLANKTSKIDVEQILGRILRQPYTKRHNSPLLNMSYAFTCSVDFQETLDIIIKSLNASGFSRRDYRTTENILLEDSAKPSSTSPVSPVTVGLFDENERWTAQEPLHSNETCNKEAHEYKNNTDIDKIITEAKELSEQYNNELDGKLISSHNNLPCDLHDMITQYSIRRILVETARNILLPQFYIDAQSTGLFPLEQNLIEKGMLLDDFHLENSDSNISFGKAVTDTRYVDLNKDNDYALVTRNLSEDKKKEFYELYASFSHENKVNGLCENVVRAINNPGISDGSISRYAHRVLDAKSDVELNDLYANLSDTIKAFKNKISTLATLSSKERFFNLVAIGKIKCTASYKFPLNITITEKCMPLPNTLYEEEEKVNGFETKVIQRISDLENILFWHRNSERGGFCINGFVNHYPDFIVVTKGGMLIMVETKGDDRQNFDSADKIRLGNCWASLAGQQYRYFMVFDNKPLEGAHALNDFIGILSKIK